MAFYDNPIDYMEYIPQNLQEIIEINAMSGAINIELQKLNDYIKKWCENMLLKNADLEGVERWEKMLNIYNPLMPDLQSRINNIRSKLITRPPINISTLKQIVEAYMGVEVDVAVKNYKATIWYRGESKIADLKPLYKTIYDTIPAHILCEIMYRWLVFDELDLQNITFNDLDSKNLTFDDFEKGEWII